MKMVTLIVSSLLSHPLLAQGRAAADNAIERVEVADVRAVVVISGPYDNEDLEYVRKTPTLAVFSGASAGEPPSPDWARALKDASAHPASRLEIWTPAEHGTDYFIVNPAFATTITEWLVQRLNARASQ